MIRQRDYLVKEKERTEERLINGVTLLSSNAKNFNNLLLYAKKLKRAYFELYFKVKEKMNKRNLPISDQELRLIRTIDELKIIDLSEEVKEIKETPLQIETMHDKKWNNELMTDED